jgi:hypothetical protein
VGELGKPAGNVLKVGEPLLGEPLAQLIGVEAAADRPPQQRP